MEYTRQQLKMIFDAVPGVTMLIRILADGSGETLMHAEETPAFFGVSDDDYARTYALDPSAFVLDADRPLFLDAMKSALAGGRGSRCVCRTLHAADGYRWTHLCVRRVGELEGLPVILATCCGAGDDMLGTVTLADESDRLVYVTERGTDQLLYANRTARRDKQGEYAGKTCYQYIRGLSSPCADCIRRGPAADAPQERDWADTARGRVYHVRTLPMRFMGRSATASFIQDVTEERGSKEKLETENRRLREIVRLVPSGVAVCRVAENGVRFAAVNPLACRLLGISEQDLAGDAHAAMIAGIHPDDLAAAGPKMRELRRDGARVSIVLRRLPRAPADEMVWISMTADSIEQNGSVLVFASLTDVTAQMKAAADNDRIRRRYELAVEMAGLGILEYDIITGTLTVFRHLKNRFVEDRVLHNVPDSVAELALGDDDLQTIRNACRRIGGGESPVSFEAWIRDPADSAPRCLKMIFLTDRDENGRPSVAYGIQRNVTEERLEEQRYRQIVSDIAAADPNALITMRADLNTGLVQSLIVRGQTVPGSGPKPGDSLEDVCGSIFSRLTPAARTPENRRKLSAAWLLEQFAAGRTILTEEYEFGDEKAPVYAAAYCRLIRDPGTGHVEVLGHMVDTTDARLSGTITSRLAETEFDFIALITAGDGMMSVYSRRQDLTVPPPAEVCSYEAALEAILRENAEPDELPQALASMKLSAVIGTLDRQDTCSWAVTLRAADGTRSRKLYKYSWLDAHRTRLLFFRIDVTDVFRREQESADRLRTALTAARQASQAKTSFLSRMSHEIRTPMNAIIGMDALAAQAIGNDEKVSDCIAKIGISARYLLSLINDILDMSRIESGKMLLKNEKFLFGDFIGGINTLIFGQASAKGLDYECVVSNEIEEAYIGDAMKLQQILVNILGNAVKFTAKGKISLEVIQTGRTGDLADLRFVVNDTGCGISEADQTRIFEPFEQADSSSTTIFGGTGLGLAIAKSLAELMGGRIRLRSIVGVGSEFTVDVPLAVDGSVAVRPKYSSSFEKLRTLMVDDDLLVCEQTVAVLKEIGMQGEWVTSGREAVNRVKRNSEKSSFYDFILIDWKMPDMDGVETTREIRRIVGPDVTIIIITAYDWQAIETEARAAGANMLISKPLFKSTLISAFERARGQAEEKKADLTVFDFTGMRVLVAEDNQINAEISKSLLEARNFAVETAANGLRALEMFVGHAPGYYDAILMDVRMPMMDGLTATTNIRHWSREDARTIPIIAMTANAFDEDVEKSRAAGMNAHLSKPIEPEVLYRTLWRILGEHGEG